MMVGEKRESKMKGEGEMRDDRRGRKRASEGERHRKRVRERERDTRYSGKDRETWRYRERVMVTWATAPPHLPATGSEVRNGLGSDKHTNM